MSANTRTALIMAAVVALMAKEQKTPALRFQLLMWPVTNAQFATFVVAGIGFTVSLLIGELFVRLRLTRLLAIQARKLGGF